MKLSQKENPMTDEILQPFDDKNIPLLVKAVTPSWSMVNWENSFLDVDIEFIIRNGIFYNEFALQLQNDKELLAVAFVEKQNETNDALNWLQNNKKELTENEEKGLNLVVQYLQEMDSRVHDFMTKDDVKLSLFISLKSGYGEKIFQKLKTLLKKKNYKSLYLWTDSDCNYNWYPKHGFSLVEERPYSQFSTEETDFKTYIFKIDL